MLGFDKCFILKKVDNIIICLLGCLLLPGCGSAEKEIVSGELRGFSYYPGYGDMSGAYHYNSLEKDENGNWVIISSNRESFGEPTIVTTYVVSSSDESDFETFLKDKNIISLVNRKDSDDFITDYSPWGYSIVFDESSVGGGKYLTPAILKET